MAAVTTYGRTERKQSQSRDIRKSTKSLREKSCVKQVVFRARVTPHQGMHAVEFEDGHVTQGLDRDNTLIMAADLRACIDDRHPSRYVAQWDGAGALTVTVLM